MKERYIFCISQLVEEEEGVASLWHRWLTLPQGF